MRLVREGQGTSSWQLASDPRPNFYPDDDLWQNRDTARGGASTGATGPRLSLAAIAEDERARLKSIPLGSREFRDEVTNPEADLVAQGIALLPPNRRASVAKTAQPSQSKPAPNQAHSMEALVEQAIALLPTNRQPKKTGGF